MQPFPATSSPGAARHHHVAGRAPPAGRGGGSSGTAPRSDMAALAGADGPPSMHVPTHRREPASRAAFREPVAGRILIGLHPTHPHGPPALPERKPKT